MKLIRYLAVGGTLMLIGAALDCIYGRRCRQHADAQLDDALDSTYPASDPTATQDFSSPDDRRLAH
jgi:hypothetical protein